MEDLTKTFGLNLTRILRKKNITQNEFARMVGGTSGNVSLWCQGKVFPRAEMIEKIAKKLNVSIADLLLDSSILTAQPKAMHRDLPLYGEISAGQGFFSDSNIIRYIAVDDSVKGDFGVVVKGSSMIGAGIRDGDVAILIKNYRFSEGKIYAVWQIGEELSYLKRVYLRDNRYLLLSENPEFAPIVMENNEALIVGELAGLYRKVKQ